MSDANGKVYSLLFAGVGGQGVLLGAEITALAAVREGYDVKQTEVHGVSQRGGSVETHVRFGRKVWSPVVTPGKADLVIGLEALEALRFAHYAHPAEGVVLVNQHEIIPGSVKDAERDYPHGSAEFIRSRGYRVLALEASHLARELGDGRMANMVMLGAVSKLLPLSHETWLETLRQRIPERFRQPNLEAFAAGREVVLR
jgi:indolepyruvate ferredoxin oxidoreductase beta subunit